jgi:preprotein translocase subunit SecY
VTETVKENTPAASTLGWAVTAGALLLFWAGGHLPLPGLSPEALAEGAARGRAGSLMVFSLGVTPILTSWFIVGLVRVLIPALGGAQPGRLTLAARSLALVLAGVQASSVGAAAEDIPGLVDDPGLAFRAEVVAAMVGATAVLLWLADLVDRRGVGDGLLLLFAVQTLAAFARTVALLFAGAHAGRLEPSAPWMWIGAVACACALTGLAARGDGFWRGLDPWPPLLAFGAGSLLSIAVLLVGTLVGASADASIDWLSRPLGRTTVAVLTAALFGLFALMRSGGEPIDAKAMAAQMLVVFAGGMLWLVAPYGASVSGCIFLLFAAAVTSLVARGQPRLAFE